MPCPVERLTNVTNTAQTSLPLSTALQNVW